MKSKKLSVPVLLAVFCAGFAAPEIQAAVVDVFADGVSKDGGWYDANKIETSSYCWTASTANVISWWQERADSSQIPAGTPTGNTKIFDTIKDAFANTGNTAEAGLIWWFGGGSTPAMSNVSGGRYWENYVTANNLASSSGVPPYIQTGYAQNSSGVTGATDFASTITEWFNEGGGGVSLNINTANRDGDWGTAGHAITLWGVTYDDSDASKITGIYITDSDDKLNGCGDELRYYEVKYVTTKWVDETEDKGEIVPAWDDTKIYIQDYMGIDGWNDYALVQYVALNLPIPVPEPSTFGGLAGLFALAFAAARRRRSPRKN